MTSRFEPYHETFRGPHMVATKGITYQWQCKPCGHVQRKRFEQCPSCGYFTYDEIVTRHPDNRTVTFLLR